MGRVCVIRQFYFPSDPRVRREVEALVSCGHEVDVICLLAPGQSRAERWGKIKVYRLPLSHRRTSVVRYILQYALFLLASMLLSGLLHIKRRYELIQVHSMPDVLVFAAVIPRLLGTRVLLDLHECMPEFYATKFKIGLKHPAVRLIARAEQLSIHFADHVITCTKQMREAFISRGAPAEKIDVVLNAADETIFDPERFPPRERTPGRFVLISHGTIEERYGLDTIIRAVALLRHEIPELRLEIYGNGSYREHLRDLAQRLSVENHVYFSEGFVPISELLQAIARADAGVVAIKRDAFRDLTHCNKMFDFIANRRPTIVSRTRAVEEYFDESCFRMFTSDDEQELAEAIRELYENPGLGDRLVQNATRVNEPYRWQHQRQWYCSIVDNLLKSNRGSTETTLNAKSRRDSQGRFYPARICGRAGEDESV